MYGKWYRENLSFNEEFWEWYRNLVESEASYSDVFIWNIAYNMNQQDFWLEAKYYSNH